MDYSCWATAVIVIKPQTSMVTSLRECLKSVFAKQNKNAQSFFLSHNKYLLNVLFFYHFFFSQNYFVAQSLSKYYEMEQTD